MGQLVFVGNFLSDVAYIIKEHKGQQTIKAGV